MALYPRSQFHADLAAEQWRSPMSRVPQYSFGENPDVNCCTNCGAAAKSQSRFCVHCGSGLPNRGTVLNDVPPHDQDWHDFEDGRGPVLAHRHSIGGGWVANTATVDASALVTSNAAVFENAQVLDHASVVGTAWVLGDAVISDHARVSGDAEVGGHARVWGRAEVGDSSLVIGRAQIYDFARVGENAQIVDEAVARGNAQIYGNPLVGGDRLVEGDEIVIGVDQFQ